MAPQQGPECTIKWHCLLVKVIIFNGINSWKKTLHATLVLNFLVSTNIDVPNRAPLVS
jgi:hypothetical protein